jgi:hypothetical protein
LLAFALQGSFETYFDIIVNKALNELYDFVDHIRNGSSDICLSSNVGVCIRGSVHISTWLKIFSMNILTELA